MTYIRLRPKKSSDCWQIRNVQTLLHKKIQQESSSERPDQSEMHGQKTLTAGFAQCFEKVFPPETVQDDELTYPSPSLAKSNINTAHTETKTDKDRPSTTKHTHSQVT